MSPTMTAGISFSPSRDMIIGHGNLHRSTVMNMLAGPETPEGGHAVSAVWDVPVATTVKVSDTAAMEAAFRSLLDFDPSGNTEPSGISEIYRRIGSPVEVAFNWAMTLAEGVGSTHWALTFSDGMRAINALVEFSLFPGDELIVSKPLYGCTDNYFSGVAPQRGFKIHTVDFTNPGNILTALNPRVKLVYFESVTNPNLRVYDLQTISRLAKEQNPNILIVVDNTFPSPAGCNPLLHGADMVAHSLTKAVGGFSQEMAGAAILPRDLWMKLFLYRKNTGGVASPEQVHQLLTRGLPTLYDRFGKMQANAGSIASYLSESQYIGTTIYPGLGNYQYIENALKLLHNWDGKFAPGFMLAFIPKGETEEEREHYARAILDYIARNGGGIITHAVSLGGFKSLIEMPYLGTHATVPDEEKRLWGIEKGMVRFSVGIAKSDDQIALLDAAIGHAYR